MKKSEEKAVNFYNKKNYKAALRSFLQLETENPNNEEILFYIASCYEGLEQKEDALTYYKKALKSNKKSDTAAANLSIIYYQMQDYAQARTYAKKALRLNRLNPAALSMLGNLAYCNHKYETALKYYKAAMDVKRDYYTAVLNAASVYYEKKDYKTAYYYAKRMSKIYPDSDEAKMLLAEICVELEFCDEGLLLLADFYQKNPQDFWTCNLLSQVFQQKKEFAKALDMGWRAVTLSDGQEAQQINFGYLLYEIAIESSAVDIAPYAQQWIEKYPQNPVAQHMAKAILHYDGVTQINNDYIKGIFDVFAEDFEDVLGELNYAVPAQLEMALENLSQNIKLPKMRILDAGCGTGLCGKYLKKYSCFRGLDGVDISKNMLEVAKRKKIYTHLYNMDLSKFLAVHENRYNLINAADVFTYFGELGSVFNLMFDALKSGGRVLFSVSENNVNKDDYYLHLSGRFLHRRKYVEEGLKRRGFIVEKLNRVKLRNEGDNEVWGWIVMARKP